MLDFDNNSFPKLELCGAFFHADVSFGFNVM